MKISEQEKARTRIRLLEAAVDVIVEKGYKSASMREIAQRANVGDATIYNYFPSKEKLLYGYCEEVQRRVRVALMDVENFHQFSIGEQLQQLVETELQTWLPAREFLQEVFELTFSSPVAAYEHLKEARKLNAEMVLDLLDAAMEVGEIPPQPYQDLLTRLLWDYQSAILAYWLKDDSEGFANTTRLVDQSMEIVAGVLQAGLVGKLLDLISFIFRTHVIGRLQPLGDLRGPLGRAKRHFMGDKDEPKRS
ncbi:TetR family transcriptional regulator [Pseudoduganella sp. FT93W]|uniref:TetR family transcriptional regulator n=1 Tax=Duganella fentianensis TaxID=2692177 RepID=A0A845HYP5_9BURK|nr:TetR family transcriptional regulator [Duganella fentianensis]MYN43598.1 TetR family transcriptional regulator [Duganella fentianensis]